MDIDDTETNPFGSGVDNRGVDDDAENIQMTSTSSRRGSEDTTYLSSHTRTHGETSFIEGIDEHTRLIAEESKRDEAWGKIRSKFSKVNTTKFTATSDDIGRVFVKLIRINSKYSPLFNKDGELNDKLPKTIKDALSTPAGDIAETNREEITRREKKKKNYKLLEKQLLKTKRRKLTLISKNNETKFQDLKPKMKLLRSEWV